MTDFLEGFQSTKTVAMTEHEALTSPGEYLGGKCRLHSKATYLLVRWIYRFLDPRILTFKVSQSSQCFYVVIQQSHHFSLETGRHIWKPESTSLVPPYHGRYYGFAQRELIRHKLSDLMLETKSNVISIDLDGGTRYWTIRL